MLKFQLISDKLQLKIHFRADIILSTMLIAYTTYLIVLRLQLELKPHLELEDIFLYSDSLGSAEHVFVLRTH